MTAGAGDTGGSADPGTAVGPEAGLQAGCRTCVCQRQVDSEDEILKVSVKDVLAEDN